MSDCQFTWIRIIALYCCLCIFVLLVHGKPKRETVKVELSDVFHFVVTEPDRCVVLDSKLSPLAKGVFLLVIMWL